MTQGLDVGALLRQLDESGVVHVLIGGLAVNAWGVIRSKDVDVCPSPDADNLRRLADVLRRLGVRQLGVGDDGFAGAELPFDPTRAQGLTEGGNFRLETPFGVLDIMQWIPGIEGDRAYPALAATPGGRKRSGSRFKCARSRICGG